MIIFIAFLCACRQQSLLISLAEPCTNNRLRATHLLGSKGHPATRCLRTAIGNRIRGILIRCLRKEGMIPALPEIHKLRIGLIGLSSGSRGCSNESAAQTS